MVFGRVSGDLGDGAMRPHSAGAYDIHVSPLVCAACRSTLPGSRETRGLWHPDVLFVDHARSDHHIPTVYHIGRTPLRTLRDLSAHELARLAAVALPDDVRLVHGTAFCGVGCAVAYLIRQREWTGCST